jgi:pimeloyl-ACP methyl ester carboxylesterase
MAIGEPATLSSEVAGEGPPLVLIHGLSGSTRWWRRNVPDLAEQFRTYAVDLAGFGGSRRTRRFRLDEAVPLLVEWLEGQGIARASVVGHSLGGLIAARLAADAPERVDRLVLVDAAVLAFDPGIGRRAVGLVRALRWTPLDFAPLLARDALRAHPLSLGAAVAGVVRTDWRAMLAQIRAPTLVIRGERDTIVPLAVGRQIAAGIPNARLVVIPAAGHAPMWERPEAFNGDLLAFLAEPLDERADAKDVGDGL